MSDELLTIDELVSRWKCSRAYIYAAINRGTLAAYNLGGWKIQESEAERYQAAMKKQPVFRRKPGPKPKRRFITKGV